jgi:hypothetical protein
MPRFADTDAMTTTIHNITIRRATDSDYAQLFRLAALDSARPLAGDVLVGEVAGEPWAAIELADGGVIADPFRPTTEVVELLRLRFTLMRSERRVGGRRLGRLRLRSATA